jgi:UDP-N-acetylmuramate--alanine ligase
MAGWIMTEVGRDPTIMNGAVMKNFAGDDSPFASSRVGNGDLFVSEVDESDGSIALYRPEVAVLNNISLDHKTMDELRKLFADFLTTARHAIWNADDAESRALTVALNLPGAISFGFADDADVRASDVEEAPLSSRFTLHIGGQSLAVTMQVPGRHNIANALAAIAAVNMLGVPAAEAARAIAGFTGLGRRFELVGETNGIVVIDDFGHNPDKVSATLATLKAFDGRVIAFFQPHGYGPIRVMGKELAQVIADRLDAEDRVIICDPAYFGGSVDRSIGAEFIVDAINAASGADGVRAEHIPSREDCGKRIVALAQPGDRIVIMGARDDTLSTFARSVLSGIA